MMILKNLQHRKKRKEDIGLSPFDIKKREADGYAKPTINAINYSVEGAVEIPINSMEELKAFTDTNQKSWINIAGVNDEALMSQLSESYCIPANIVSDIMDVSLRPQIEDYDDGLFASIKMMMIDETTGDITKENVCFVVTNNIIFSFVESSIGMFAPIKNRIQRRKSKIHGSGTDYMFFALLDVVIDNYIYILDMFGDRVEDLEEELTLKTEKSTLFKINLLKQELNRYRREIKPAKEMIFSLRKLDTDFISDDNDTHFKELQDNISQASEMIDYYREVLYDAIDVYHSAMSTRLNDIMAVLTVFSVVFIPLSFITGLYGMNFANMPELNAPYGYYIALGAMAIIAVVMLLYFRKKKWF